MDDKWVEFVGVSSLRNVHAWRVMSTSASPPQHLLGGIRWLSAWQCYAFSLRRRRCSMRRPSAPLPRSVPRAPPSVFRAHLFPRLAELPRLINQVSLDGFNNRGVTSSRIMFSAAASIAQRSAEILFDVNFVSAAPCSIAFSSFNDPTRR